MITLTGHHIELEFGRGNDGHNKSIALFIQNTKVTFLFAKPPKEIGDTVTHILKNGPACVTELNLTLEAFDALRDVMLEVERIKQKELDSEISLAE